MTTFMPAAKGWPVTILVGQAAGDNGQWGAPTWNVTRFVPLESVRIEESGNYEPGRASFTLIQEPLGSGNSMPSNAPYFTNYLRPEGTVLIRDGGEDTFRGNIRNLRPTGSGILREVTVECVDIGALLDKTIVASSFTRPAGESDKTRISYLFATFGFAMPNVDLSGVQTLESSMPKQTFANCTLRQALEKVLGQASKTANYWIEPSGRLRTWDRDNPDLDASGSQRLAPYQVVISSEAALKELDSTEIAPEDLEIDWDTGSLVNWVKVRGATAAGRLVIVDNESVARYGRRQAFIDAPDADTVAKATRVGLAVMADAAEPAVRGSFSVQGVRTAVPGGGSTKYGARWRPAMTMRVTSPFHGLTAEPYRVNRVTTTFLNGRGDRHQDVEFGHRRKWLRGGFER